MLKIFFILSCLSVGALALPRVKDSKRVPILIIGGEEAVQYEFPAIVSLHYFGTHFCSAIIIRHDVLLTSGQCAAVAAAPSELTVKAGKHNLAQTENTEQIRSIQSIVFHPDFESDTSFSNDIAILRIDTPFVFNGAVAPVPLAHMGHTAEGNATILGWGSTTEDGVTSDILHKATLPLVTDVACREAYGAANQIDDNMICAGFPEGGVDTCVGDTGGPLLSRDLGFTYLAGIASFGVGCGRPGIPSVYVEVSYHIDFIAENSA